MKFTGYVCDHYNFVNSTIILHILSEFLTFGSYADSAPDFINIWANNFYVTRKERLKYLDVMIDYNLK